MDDASADMADDASADMADDASADTPTDDASADTPTDDASADTPTDDSLTDGFDAMRGLVEQFPHADAETVYGEPVTQGDRTVVPVARVSYRFGGGFGSGSEGEVSRGYGGGGGGGVTAEPAGALEVSADGTRFVDVREGSSRRWLAVVAFALGALLGWLGRR